MTQPPSNPPVPSKARERHTPGMIEVYGNRSLRSVDGHGIVAECWPAGASPTGNAARLALAWNSHASLVAACEWARTQLQCRPHLDDPDCPACSGHNPIDQVLATLGAKTP